MAEMCPAPGPDDPLVGSLLGVVDCNVDGLVRGGYGALAAPSSGFSLVLTTLLTLYVAILGYQLMLGRAPLRIGDLALTAVKIGAILALTSGWSTYQTLVYHFLFDGPVQLAGALLSGVQPRGSLFRGDVTSGLQAVFDALNAFAATFAKNVAVITQGSAAPGVVPGAAGPAFAVQALTVSAMTLLFSTLGVLLASKIVLGLLLAIGPVFIALLLFASTRGLFEGWLRATLAAALAPLAATVLLGVALTVLEPSLLRLRDNLAQNDFSLGPVYSILVLVMVFAAVGAGALVAGGVIALGLKLPVARRQGAHAAATVTVSGAAPQVAFLSRADRLAAATATMARRDAAVLTQAAGVDDRRTSVTLIERGRAAQPSIIASAGPERLGQSARRRSAPKARRSEGAGRR